MTYFNEFDTHAANSTSTVPDGPGGRNITTKGQTKMVITVELNMGSEKTSFEVDERIMAMGLIGVASAIQAITSGQLAHGSKQWRSVVDMLKTVENVCALNPIADLFAATIRQSLAEAEAGEEETV